ncbi:MAG: homoserine kinase, partial [Gammaproteobacteria bacterium]|nr:homoserine kinase [Gammaproteobacteria bacterium]
MNLNNENRMSVSVFAPISIGNVSVGFDILGLAVLPIDGSLVGDIVHIKAIESSNDLVVTGTHADRLPAEKSDNIVWQCLQVFNHELENINIPVTNVHMTLEKNIPVSSGLGSSACSIVAAVAALNEFYEQPFDKQKLL